MRFFSIKMGSGRSKMEMGYMGAVTAYGKSRRKYGSTIEEMITV
jgi:hypothetical protein